MSSLLRGCVSWVVVVVLLALVGCDSGSADVEQTQSDCQSRTGNTMSATVNGASLCTDLGTALLLTTTELRLSVVGLFGGGTISFNIDDPRVGTFDLTQPGATHDAQYGTADETAYVVDRDEGSGTVTITALTDARVQGTFAFSGVGYDINGDETGARAEVENGTFDFALGGDDGLPFSRSDASKNGERTP